VPLGTLYEIRIIAGTQGLRNEVGLDILDVGVALEFAFQPLQEVFNLRQ
jgi:hypothetical protein